MRANIPTWIEVFIVLFIEVRRFLWLSIYIPWHHIFLKLELKLMIDHLVDFLNDFLCMSILINFIVTNRFSYFTVIYYNFLHYIWISTNLEWSSLQSSFTFLIILTQCTFFKGHSKEETIRGPWRLFERLLWFIEDRFFGVHALFFFKDYWFYYVILLFNNHSHWRSFIA